MARQTPDPEVYSRRVGILKIMLPLIAVGLLSTVFLVQKEDAFESGLVFTKVDIATLGDGLTISNPRFSGITNRGDTYTLAAARAVPDGPKPRIVEMSEITADMSYAEGTIVNATAAQGIADVQQQTLQLNGGLNASSSNAYTFTTDGGLLSLNSGDFESSGPVKLTGPQQTLKAGRMRIAVQEDGTSRFFHFENGVHLTYTPETTED